MAKERQFLAGKFYLYQQYKVFGEQALESTIQYIDIIANIQISIFVVPTNVPTNYPSKPIPNVIKKTTSNL